jgi:L-aspartate oxidase
MWSAAGIRRDSEGLRLAQRLLSGGNRSGASVDRSSWEERQMALVAGLMVQAALAREESRGAHYRTDFPASDESWARHQVYVRAD